MFSEIRFFKSYRKKGIQLMEARKIKLLEFIGNGKKTFNIPVYQRNYDWKEEQCRKLFEDIQKPEGKEIFIGTIDVGGKEVTISVRNYSSKLSGNK